MARPRIFLSSTYFDLKQVRMDIERFIKDSGYESVLNEHGNIPYGNDKRLEEYCYKEIELCDMLVSIIGGRYGTQSHDGTHSISNIELKTAIEKGRQVYIFIEKSVMAEYRTYMANKENDNIHYAAVDNVNIYRFIDEIQKLQINNQIHPFETASDITNHLKEQWAGLFQRLLSDYGRQKEINIIESLRATAKTLNQTVEYLTSEKSEGDKTINAILLSNHPAFESLRQKTGVKFRIFFQSLSELRALMLHLGYEEGFFIIEDWAKEGYYSWQKNSIEIIHIAESLFDSDDRLKIYSPIEWVENWIIEDILF
ncbi:hypothetical protein QF022_001393 [Vogesella perlucida]|nr:hypothetical protein [Vogesella perlucida]